MTILIVRHGETDGNAARVLQRLDVPLNERGMRQAEELARRLSAQGFVRVLCSDLLRARMTAAPLAACSGLAVEESPLLQERNFGDLRGMPYAALAEDPFGPDFAPPNGEDWPTFHARVAEAFALIVDWRRGANGTLVVVTHGLVCRALVARHAFLPEGAVVPERFDNTGVTILHEDAPHGASLINCTRHHDVARNEFHRRRHLAAGAELPGMTLSAADVTRYLAWAVVMALGALLALLDRRWIERPLFAVLLLAGIGGGVVVTRLSPFSFGGGDYYMEGVLLSAGSALALVGYILASAWQFVRGYLSRHRGDQ